MSEYRYVAKDAYEGAHLPGGNVPARDLDADELPEIAARRGQTVKELRADLEQCGLYAGHGEGSKASKPAKPASKAVALGKKTQATSQAVAAGLAKLGDADDPEPKPSPPVLPIQTGPTGEMVEPAPIEPKAP